MVYVFMLYGLEADKLYGSLGEYLEQNGLG